MRNLRPAARAITVATATAAADATLFIKRLFVFLFVAVQHIRTHLIRFPARLFRPLPALADPREPLTAFVGPAGALQASLGREFGLIRPRFRADLVPVFLRSPLSS